MAHSVEELTWLCSFLLDLGIPLVSVLIIWCGNVSAIALAFNPVFHSRTKYIEIDYHFIRKKVLSKQVNVRFISSMEKVAAIFT